MKHQLNISYPQHWLDAMQVTQQAFEEDAKMAMAAKMFEMKRLSSGMAAKLVGISRAQFYLVYIIMVLPWLISKKTNSNLM